MSTINTPEAFERLVSMATFAMYTASSPKMAVRELMSFGQATQEEAQAALAEAKKREASR